MKMYMKQIVMGLVLILLFGVLSSCGERVVAHTEAPELTPSEYVVSPKSDSAAGSEKSTESKLEDRGDEFPEILLSEYSVDLDGDKVADKARLYAVPRPVYAENGVPGYGYVIHDAKLEVEIGDDLYSHVWELSYHSTLSVMTDFVGRNVCVLVLDKGGSGSGKYIVPIIFKDGILTLPLPHENRYQTKHYGFSGLVTYEDGYKVTIEIPETGFSAVTSIPDYLNLSMIYDENGFCLSDDFYGGIQPISGVKVVSKGENDVLVISQCINEPLICYGFLISELTWNDSDYIVINQWIQTNNIN